MTSRPWESLLSDRDRQLLDSYGYGNCEGAAQRPAVLQPLEQPRRQRRPQPQPTPRFACAWQTPPSDILFVAVVVKS